MRTFSGSEGGRVGDLPRPHTLVGWRGLERNGPLRLDPSRAVWGQYPRPDATNVVLAAPRKGFSIRPNSIAHVVGTSYGQSPALVAKVENFVIDHGRQSPWIILNRAPYSLGPAIPLSMKSSGVWKVRIVIEGHTERAISANARGHLGLRLNYCGAWAAPKLDSSMVYTEAAKGWGRCRSRLYLVRRLDT